MSIANVLFFNIVHSFPIREAGMGAPLLSPALNSDKIYARWKLQNILKEY